MSAPQLVINIIANTDALIKSLEAGRGAIEKYGPTVDTMRDNWARSSALIIEKAALVTAGMQGITTATLTAGQASQNLKVLEAGMAQLQRAGQPIPAQMQATSDQLKAMGASASTTSPILSGLAGKLAGMFTIGAIVAFGRQILTAGDQIQKMADQTSMSTVEVQKLQYVAGQSGTSMSSLVSAAQNLQQRLGDDNSGAAAAIRKLNINLTDFSALRSYDQMTMLSESLRTIEDPTDRAAAAAAVFGKNWKEILPAILSGMQEVGDEAPVMSDAAVKALDAAGDALMRLKDSAITVGGGIALGFQQLFSILSGDFKEVGGLVGYLVDKTDTLTPALARIKAPALAASAAQRDMGLSAAEAARLERELTYSAEESIRVNKDFADAAKKSAAEAKKFADDVNELNQILSRAPQIIKPGDFDHTIKAWVDQEAAIAKLNLELAMFNREMMTVSRTVNAADFAGSVAEANREWEFALEAGREYDSLLSDINNQNALRQMAKDAGVEIDALVPKVANIQTGWLGFEAVGKMALSNLAGTFQRAFEGGGGLIGAMKSYGIQLANDMITPMLQGLSVVQQKAVGLGASLASVLGGKVGGGVGATVAGIASSLGGAAIAATSWGASMTAAGVAGTVALSAATLGIGAAAVGIYALAKHFIGVSAAEKEGRLEADKFRVSLAGMMTDMDIIEAKTLVAQGANQQWAATAVMVKNAYVAAGLSGEQALAAVDRLWKAEKQGGDAVKVVIEEIERVMRQRLIPSTRDTELAFQSAAYTGVVAFDRVQAEIQNLTNVAILSGQSGLIGALHTLEAQMQTAAMNGVTDFAFMASSIEAIKAQIATAIQIPVSYALSGSLPSAPSFPSYPSPPSGGGGSGGGGGGGGFSSSDQAIISMIQNFLANNPGDRHRIPSALGIDMGTVSRLGFERGTPGLGFMNFGAGTWAKHHGFEAVVPKGREGEFASQHVGDASVKQLAALRGDMARDRRMLPGLLASAMLDALVQARVGRR